MTIPGLSVFISHRIKKARSEGKKCHVTTMMSRKVDRSLKKTPTGCSGFRSVTKSFPRLMRGFLDQSVRDSPVGLLP